MEFAISTVFAALLAFIHLVAPAAITVGCVLLILWRFDIRKVLGYATYFDITFTVALAFMYAGTYTGMMTAMLSGLILSIVFNFMRWNYGFKRIHHVKGLYFEWRYYPPGATHERM